VGGCAFRSRSTEGVAAGSESGCLAVGASEGLGTVAYCSKREQSFAWRLCGAIVWCDCGAIVWWTEECECWLCRGCGLLALPCGIVGSPTAEDPAHVRKCVDCVCPGRASPLSRGCVETDLSRWCPLAPTWCAESLRLTGALHH
jgi:hypothetical protein